jgi:hypothetical protein
MRRSSAGRLSVAMRASRFSLIAGLLLTPASAHAQTVQQPRIYRDCAAEARAAQARGGEPIVCGDREARSPYRLPEQPDRFDPYGDVQSVSRERHSLYEVGESGLYSCGNVGPGGHTGCGFRRFKQSLEQHGK